MLPDEVWEDILKFLDVCHLLQLKRVSQNWRDIITRVIERECKWYEKCVKDVPEDLWSSILEHHTHPEICCDDFHRAKKCSEIWISLYKSWIGWNTLVEKSSSTETIEMFSEAIEGDKSSCLDAKSNVVAIGSGLGGKILFYDISKSSDKLIFEATHGNYVTAVHLGRVDGDTIAVSSSCMCKTDLQYWNLRTKAQIHRYLSRWYRRFVSPSFEYCHMVQDAIEENNVLCYFLKVERMGSGIELRSVYRRLQEHGYIRCISGDGSKMTLLMDDYELPAVKLYTSTPNDELKFISVNELKTGCSPGGKKLLFFKPCIAAYIDSYDGAEFGFSIDSRKWIKYNVESDLGLTSPVTYLLYHVGLLVLALKSGDVIIIYVKYADRLERLNLKAMQTKTLKLDSEPIKAVKVTECNSHQFLVAVTKKKLHLVQFH